MHLTTENTESTERKKEKTAVSIGCLVVDEGTNHREIKNRKSNAFNHGEHREHGGLFN